MTISNHFQNRIRRILATLPLRFIQEIPTRHWLHTITRCPKLTLTIILKLGEVYKTLYFASWPLISSFGHTLEAHD